MNKQEREIKKNTPQYHSIANILYIHYIYKASRSIRQKYNLNTHCITVFVSCYLLGKFIKEYYTISDIVRFLGVYSSPKVKRYVLLLCGIDMMAQRGVNKYSLTDSGIEAINEISHNSETLIYEFCSKYNLEL